MAGLTRTVLNWGSVGGLDDSRLFVLSAGGSATDFEFGSLFRWGSRLCRQRLLSNLCRPVELRFRWHGASFLKPAFAAVNLAPGIPTSLGVARNT